MKQDPSFWFDNGFSSFRAMNETHEMIEQVLEKELVPDTKVLDLGCGNGELLRRTYRRGIIPIGIEGDNRRLSSASKTLPIGLFYKSDLYQDSNFKDKPDILFYSACKLEKEEKRANRTFLLEQIRKTPKTVLYSHGKYASGRSIFDILWGCYVEFPNTFLEVKAVACTNECEAVLLCPKNLAVEKNKNSFQFASRN